MLVLRRMENQSIIIGERIVVKVLAIEADRVKFGIKAPEDVRVVRSEIADRKQRLPCRCEDSQP